MHLDVERTGDTGAVVLVHGPLNLITAPQLRELVSRIVDQEGRNWILVDMAGVDFMDSTGLHALISGLKTARLAGGDLRLAQPQPQVMTVLEMTNLDQLLLTQDLIDEWLGPARTDAFRAVA